MIIELFNSTKPLEDILKLLGGNQAETMRYKLLIENYIDNYVTTELDKLADVLRDENEPLPQGGLSGYVAFALKNEEGLIK
jgi:hypothetical protein